MLSILTLQDLSLKSSYESKTDELVQDFYIPALSCAVSYDRIAGFFSSWSLSIAAEGLAALICSGGHMRLLASPHLSESDAKIMAEATNGSKKFFENKLLNSLESVSSEFERDHLQALGWMLSNGYLEIKLVQVINDSTGAATADLFHQKVGIITDSEGNALSFSGSINESASAWIGNIEEFKVFRSWLPGQDEFYQADKKRFDSFWNGQRSYVCVMELPEAVKKRIIQYGEDFSKDVFIAKHYITRKKIQTKSIKENLSLFPYQKRALDFWIKNDYKLLFEMATGTGKTRTALACVNHLVEQITQLIVIISCPEGTLARQWRDNEVIPAGFKFESEIVADGTNLKWRTQLMTSINKLSVGFLKNLIIYTTHTTSSSSDFIERIESCKSNIPICFVADETHGLGASKSKRALLDRYNYRIGLSATPERWFDDVGTIILRNYFGNQSFEFNITDALSTLNPLTGKPFLVNYYYNPVFVSLNSDELNEYMKLTNKIRKLFNCQKDSDDYQKRYEKLVFNRANIQKNASSKLPALKKLLCSLKDDISNLLIFVSPEQIDPVMQLLCDLHIAAHRFTQKEGTSKSVEYGGISEREYLIKHFKSGDYQVLVAISCLDEGIDIPSANKAILLANSTNPREYVQRIGRVIRQSPNKSFAKIYDFLVVPDKTVILPPEIAQFEKDILKKELVRVSEMSKNAINNASVLKMVSSLD